MKKLNLQILAIAAVAAVFSSCGGNSGGGEKSVNKGSFPMVTTPSYITDREQAVRYIAKNFWDDFFKIGLDGKEKAGAVHGVDSLAFLNSFGMYAQLATMAGVQTMEAPMAELFHNLDSLALAGERKPLLKVMEQMEHYFFDPNSPVLDEEMYLRALNGILACKSLSDTDKMQYEYQHRICSLNRVGTPAADFSFRQLVASNHLPDSSPQMYSPTPPKGYADKTLYKNVKGEYTLLFFNNPDCGACGEILDAIKDSHLAELVHQKKLAVVAMYTDEDLSAWARNREKYPKEWMYAFDHKLVLRDNNIYGLRAIPSLYLLDKDKRVILKDATVDMVINALL